MKIKISAKYKINKLHHGKLYVLYLEYILVVLVLENSLVRFLR